MRAHGAHKRHQEEPGVKIVRSKKGKRSVRNTPDLNRRFHSAPGHVASNYIRIPGRSMRTRMGGAAFSHHRSSECKVCARNETNCTMLPVQKYNMGLPIQ